MSTFRRAAALAVVLTMGAAVGPPGRFRVRFSVGPDRGYMGI